jgi:hypothetical protein
VFRSLGVVSIVLLLAAPLFAHDEQTLDPYHATPGVRLELSEVPRTATAAAVTYRLRVTGVSRETIFNLWVQDFGALFHMVASGLRLDESGNVVSARPAKAGQPHRRTTIGPGPYPQGAAWSVALVSVDRAVRAFAVVIPRPIISRSGTCMVQLELVSHRGDRFVATGAGFPPGDEVTIESQYAGRAIEKRQTISAEGRLPLEVLVHETIGADHGRPGDKARYVVKCRSCAVAIDYHWGARALSRR